MTKIIYLIINMNVSNKKFTKTNLINLNKIQFL